MTTDWCLTNLPIGPRHLTKQNFYLLTLRCVGDFLRRKSEKTKTHPECPWNSVHLKKTQKF